MILPATKKRLSLILARNIKGYEMADEFAKQGADMYCIGPQPFFGASIRRHKKELQA